MVYRLTSCSFVKGTAQSNFAANVLDAPTLLRLGGGDVKGFEVLKHALPSPEDVMASRNATARGVLGIEEDSKKSAGALALQRSIEVVEQVMNGALVKTGAIPTDPDALVSLRHDYVSRYCVLK